MLLSSIGVNIGEHWPGSRLSVRSFAMQWKAVLWQHDDSGPPRGP